MTFFFPPLDDDTQNAKWMKPKNDDSQEDASLFERLQELATKALRKPSAVLHTARGRVLVNPLKVDLMGLAMRLHHDDEYVRYISDKAGNHYIWDGLQSTHPDMAEALGLDDYYNEEVFDKNYLQNCGYDLDVCMKAQLKKGSAKRGFYYKNISEDAGSVSIVVPNGSHVEPVDVDSEEKAEFHAYLKVQYGEMRGMEVAIMKNPDRKELAEVSFKGPPKEVGVWLVGNDMFAWDRFGVLHAEVKGIVKANATSLPLYVTYDNSDAHVMVTDASRHTEWDENPKTKAYILKHPQMKRLFHGMDIGYYNEDIVGLWDNLGKEKASLHDRLAALARVELPLAVVEAFTALGNAQRDRPERAMLRVQRANGGGVMNYAVEHVGDLTHRMTEMCKYGDMGYEQVKPKVERCLRMFTNGYGFLREHEENLKGNADYDKITVDEQSVKVDAALDKYVQEHTRLPVYNMMQWYAREAAITLGHKEISKTIQALEMLNRKLSNEATWDKASSIYVLDRQGQPRKFDWTWPDEWERAEKASLHDRLAELADSLWWTDMSPREQNVYLKEHPHSRMKRTNKRTVSRAPTKRSTPSKPATQQDNVPVMKPDALRMKMIRAQLGQKLSAADCLSCIKTILNSDPIPGKVEYFYLTDALDKAGVKEEDVGKLSDEKLAGIFKKYYPKIFTGKWGSKSEYTDYVSHDIDFFANRVDKPSDQEKVGDIIIDAIRNSKNATKGFGGKVSTIDMICYDLARKYSGRVLDRVSEAIDGLGNKKLRDDTSNTMGMFSKDYDRFLKDFVGGWTVIGGTSSYRRAYAIIDGEESKFWVGKQPLTAGEKIPSENMRKNLDKLHAQTQEFLKGKYAKGGSLEGKTIKIYRGAGGHYEAYTPAPVESWTTDSRTPERFGKMMAEDGRYSILEAEVPLTSVLMTWESLKGVWPAESELKGKKEWVVFGQAIHDDSLKHEQHYEPPKVRRRW